MKAFELRLRHAFGSLKLRIALGSIAALALGIVLVTALLVQQANRDTVAAHSARELSDAVRTADILAQRAIELQRALQTAGAQLDARTLADDTRLAAYIESKPVLRGLFSNLFAAAADGHMRVFADSTGVRNPKLDLADRDYFKRTVTEARPIISPPLPGRVSGEPVVVFTQPLRQGGVVFGVLGGALRLSTRDLLGTLVGSHDTAANALMVVTDASGKIIAHPRRELVGLALPAEPRLALAYQQWQTMGSPVEPSGVNLDQPLELASAAGVTGPDWVVWRALPRAEVLAPVHAARRDALVWAAAVVVALSALLWGLLWWLLRPLSQLEQRVRHLFDSAQDAHAGWPLTGGEIGRVARVLQRVSVERADLEARNAQMMRKLGSVMSAAPVGIAFTREQRFALVSAEFCRLLRRSEADLLGDAAQTIFASNADYLALGPEVARTFAAGDPYVGEHRMLRADGSHFWAELRGSPVDPGVADAGTIWTLSDIAEKVAARDQLEWSAAHDALTGLGNRRRFERAVQRVFDAQPASVPAAVVMIDLDHFKPINDTAGHAAGDAMLVAVARAIGGCVRASDLVVRLGGDEFAMLLEHCPPDVALRVAEKARSAVAAIALPWEGQTLRVGASLGVCSLEPGLADADAWVRAADLACYAAKAAGRDAVHGARQAALRLVGG